jgi:hypothetical protein
VSDEQSEPQSFSRGDRVCARAPWKTHWRIGIITDVFVAPVTGKLVYVIGGEGYYADEVTDDIPAEPQSLRA